jgi:phosphoglycerate dehydrogenase-like enzyme
VNTSRGPIVDEAALAAALKKGTIAGAGIDVYDAEPIGPDHPLLAAPNTVLTPHLGYVTRESYSAYFRGALEDIAAWRRGAPMRVL